MKHRILRPLVYALVAVQLLLSVPVATAWAAEVTAQAPTAQSMPCDDMNMPGEGHSEHCPCCPEGSTGAMDCQTACAASVGLFMVARFLLPSPVAVPTVEPLPVIFLPLADPPLKPPPII
ncbi:MAG: hypothetical protein U1F39_15410 [Steroidobacteraceae bacterium]